MTDENLGMVIKDIHEGIEAFGVDFCRDDGGVWESLGELSGFGALACAVVDDGAIVCIGD